MARARACLAARTTLKKLQEAAIEAYEGVSRAEEGIETCRDFDTVLDFCQPRTEEIGGAAGSDVWFCWQVGDYAIMADLGLLLHRDAKSIERLSVALGAEVIVSAVDTAFEYAFFAAYQGGKLKRMLTLEDGVINVLGLPVKAERGRPFDDFSEEEAERIWTSYGLPSLELDPEKGPFECVALKREG